MRRVTRGGVTPTSGVILERRGTYGTVLLQDSTNSTSAFQVQNSLGTTVLNVDTVNNRVGIGTTSPNSALDVVGSSSTTPTQIIQGASSQSADLLDLENSSGTIPTLLLTVSTFRTVVPNEF